MKKLEKKNIQDILALSNVQEGMLFHYLENPRSERYFEQLCLEIAGEVDEHVFKKAWQFVSDSNEILRTVFRWEKVEKPIQIVLDKHEINVRVFDFSGKAGDDYETLKEEIKATDRRETFDLQDVPFRISLCRMSLEPSKYMILISQHHILYDGWSTGIVLKEFLQAYDQLRRDESLSPLKKTHFKEFVKYAQKQDKKAQESYWKEYLDGFDTKTALPIKENETKESKKSKIKKHYHLFSSDFTTPMKAYLKEQEIALASMLYAAWGILLQKYNNNKDVVFGATVSGRSAQVKGVEHIVGLFINTLPMRLDTRSAGSKTLRQLLGDMNQTVRKLEEYETTPLVDIKKYSRLEGRENLFDSIFVIENYPLHQLVTDFDAFSIDDYAMYYQTNYALTVAIGAFDDIDITLTYDSAFFEDAVIERMTGHFEKILKGILEHPDKGIEAIDVLSDAEKKILLKDFNHAPGNYLLDKEIHRFFEEQVVKTPDAVCITAPEAEEDCRPGEPSTLTYRQLNEKSNRLARLLAKNGVTAGSVVGILMEPSLDMTVALMATLKAGGAYLPIEPGLPKDRVVYMLKDSGAVALISDGDDTGEIPYTALQGFEQRRESKITITAPRGHIKGFDKLPAPDRSLIDFRNYRGKIGMASVTNCISLQTTRGCPYECLYCHKIWSKKHVHRGAENMYEEIEYYYKNGVRNFAVIDDCFNLHRENSSRLFKKIVDNKLKLQMFFPNGLRGDIMTPDYIDLMAEAGTRGINLSLETASPRLQKLLKKFLDLDKFKNVVDYIAGRHPEIMLEMATMHGFPSETEEEAMMTLSFIKDIRWLHFPYIHILKIFPNTEMEEFALEQGVSKKAILDSRNRAFHELPETLPFPKSFTRKYQASFMNEYFLNKERLSSVLPVQMQVLSESALAQKYNAYLPVDINGLADIVSFARLDDFELPEEAGNSSALEIKMQTPAIYEAAPPAWEAKPGARRFLMLDLSQHFSSHAMLYKVAEQPLGLIYLLTYLNRQFGDKIHGRVYKSGSDFDSFTELYNIVTEYKPDIIGIRTLTYFREFFHEIVALLRQWGVDVPIITGGPYASSDYDTILKDDNVDLVVFGEGEETMEQLLREMLDNDCRLPEPAVLSGIPGIAYPGWRDTESVVRNVIMLDRLQEHIDTFDAGNLPAGAGAGELAYIMYTSGSTGRPKGVMVEHRQVNNCIHWMQEQFPLAPGDTALQRTNLSFDPSVWELFWPLYIGGNVQLTNLNQRRDIQYLVQLLERNTDGKIKVMYAPAALVTAMVRVLESLEDPPSLVLPWFIIGAEPIRMETVKGLYDYLEGRVVNTYGPTECTINNTYYPLLPDDPRGIVPIGRPVANNQIYILSGDMQLMPVGIPGEICIAGESVARGYVNNFAKTREAFSDNPFGPGKLYKTGDIGLWLEDGNIEIIGRSDDQVKIRGFRIEPGEIENTLALHSDVDSCIVVTKDSGDTKKEIKECRLCGVTTQYPNITIDDDDTCNLCRDFYLDKPVLDKYFKTLEDLKQTVLEAGRDKKSKYDCLMVYNGGRGAAYALYHMVEMGLKVLPISYDNGYFGKADFKNVKKITHSLGLDHVIMTHKNTDLILKESLNTVHSVCRGCFLTGSAIAGTYALENDIPVVVNCTFSRGQIIDNKLFMFLKQGIIDIGELEKQTANFSRSAPDMEKSIFDLIDMENVSNKKVYDDVKFLDFYRYSDVTNQDMIEYLNNRDPYWKRRRNYAVYSTNCPIKQIGDYAHLQDRDFHFYGAATSWEKRLGHLGLQDIKVDLKCNVTPKGFRNFADRIDYKKSSTQDIGGKYLCAYFTSKNPPSVSQLREFLEERLPDYMVPAHFVKLDNVPLTPSGKIDKKRLPEPKKERTGATYVEPKSGLEKDIAEIWKSVLELDAVGANDNFFDLGGNSINVIQVSTKLKSVVDQDVPVVTLFTYTTVQSLADNLGKEGGNKQEVQYQASRSEEREKGKSRLKKRIKKTKKTLN